MLSESRSAVLVGKGKGVGNLIVTATGTACVQGSWRDDSLYQVGFQNPKSGSTIQGKPLQESDRCRKEGRVNSEKESTLLSPTLGFGAKF